MNVVQVIEFIKDFRQRGGNWYELAVLINEVSKNAWWVGHYSSNSEWLKAAADASGYSASSIRRIVRLRDFLQRVSLQEDINLGDICEIPIAILEVIDRMFPLDPPRAAELLRATVQGKVTLRKVRKEYDDLVHKKPDRAGDSRLTPRLASSFEQKAFAAVVQSANIFSYNKENIEFKKCQRGPLGISADLVVIGDDLIGEGRYVDGFDFKFFSSGNQYFKNRYNHLQQIAFHSQFFRRYWVIFSQGIGIEGLKELIVQLRVLDLKNVGVAVLKDDFDHSASDDPWIFIASVFRPENPLPQVPVYFPSDEEYHPRWEHIFLHYISSNTDQAVP